MIETRQVYRAMERPAYVGEIRMKSWRTVGVYVAPGLGQKAGELTPDDTEMQRVGEYWARQRELYGYDFDTVKVQVDIIDVDGPILTSSVKVTRILPGERA